jgi:hypothetical protein
MLFAIQVVRNTVPDSVTELKARFDWSVLHIYDSDKSGNNRNGLLLAGRGWQPEWPDDRAPPAAGELRR